MIFRKTTNLTLSIAALVTLYFTLPSILLAQKWSQPDKFRQLEEILPTANAYRTASGAPGRDYWQQRADYDIHVTLDDDKQRIVGQETITYTNHSPDELRYLWLQLDNNIFAPDSNANKTLTAPSFSSGMSLKAMQAMMLRKKFDGGVKITSVKDDQKRELKYHIVSTMMRVQLPQPLQTGKSFRFSIDWNFNINDTKFIRSRTGYEYFPEDKNYLYEMAHWYPRMVSYTDATGWQHKQFLGRGEFTLEFGNFVVRITAPDDHVVAATGVLLNPKEVLSEAQRTRLEEARKAKKPMFIVTPDEAKANESNKPKGVKTWIFKADNVRDFAFASSRKFIWDAQGHNVDGNAVMCMSYYPKEGEPLWSRYSTHAIIHTLNVYSRYTFRYPYPVAISVNGPVGGMEYPMICFNGPRPEKDGTYSKRTKYGLISVIIHEVGHNYFPMIVNSDERQWTWMDEGINTFLQFLAEQEWEENYPSRRGEPRDITAYMSSNNQVPVMTNSDSILQFGNNAYAKPATALNILRETVLGRENFDFAFKEYAQRWMFKRPMPADFFRTMEDASGVDLDWFWRGWFYSTDHTDIAVSGVREFTIRSGNPEVDKPADKAARDAQRPETLSAKRNKSLAKRTGEFPELKDFYNTYDPYAITDRDRKAYESYVKRLSADEKKILGEKKYFYVVDLKNIGGLVMPVIIQAELEGGGKQEFRIPAEIWRRNSETVSKLIVLDKPLKSVLLDPHHETADTDTSNNYFPPRITKSRFRLFKDLQQRRQNEMRRAQQAAKAKKGK